MRQAASPVCVVTASVNGQRVALTISSFQSVSADPPLVSICINRQSRMHEALTEARAFSVAMLAADQAHVADTFAGRPQKGKAYDFSCVGWTCRGEGREPLMLGVTVAAECIVVSTVELGSHCLFVAAVQDIVISEKLPLLYWNRAYCVPSTTRID
ncbi:flavin reductase family protein [Ancylobacter sp. G4_0304]|uniref:flavin reductase family protein n=1 Tax=Ancylobacter sp. G4_0304 TaxID=3114289 RepID=UPI0039C5F749